MSGFGGIPPEGVYYDVHKRAHVVVIVLDPDEADNLASGLAVSDVGGHDLMAWADEARAKDRHMSEES